LKVLLTNVDRPTTVTGDTCQPHMINCEGLKVSNFENDLYDMHLP